MTLPKYFLITMVIMLIIPLLAGCSATTTIAKGADFAVSKYCKIPSAGRSAVRAAVGRAVHPNSITITCADD
jgi:hypothetical protein